MKTTKRSIALLLAVVLVLACLTACGKSSPPSKPTASGNSSGGEYEDTVYTAYTGDLDTADPYGSTSSQQQFFTNLTFDTVTYVDAESGAVMPKLAKSWKDVSANQDGTVWEFYLQQNVKFHNSDSFTANDVKFTWEYCAAAAKSVVKPLAAAANVSAIDVVDDYTVRFTLTTRMQDFPSYLETKIYSKNAFDTMDAKQAAVIGTGPYYYDTTETKSGVQYVATRNDNYWGGTDQYKTKHICFKYIADENTQVASLQSGELDFVFNSSSSYYSTLSNDNNLTAYSRNGANSYYLGFNYTNDKLKDLQVRQAICMAINKDDIAFVAYDGGVGGSASYNFCVPTGLGYSQVKALEYNKDQTKQLLSQLGYENGLNLTLIYYSMASKMAEVVQSNLKDAGINVTLQQVDVTNWTSVKASKEGYDLFIDYCAYQGALLYNFNRFFYTGGSSNVYDYRSAEYEAEQKKVQDAGSWDDMLKQFTVLQQWTADNIPIFPLIYTTQLAAAQKDVQNLTLAPSTNYMDFSKVCIPKRS